MDFDHTLLAANSTELFISRCRPKAVTAVVEFLIRHCFPWGLVAGQAGFRIRDYLCCLVLLVFIPGNRRRWAVDAPKLFAEHRSETVQRWLSRAPQGAKWVIISFGLDALIRPMLARSEWAGAMLIATPLWSRPSHFWRGKLMQARALFSGVDIAGASFFTDSPGDSDLLDAVVDRRLITPQGQVRPAGLSLYLPLRYLICAKYPRRYVFDQFSLVDIALVVVCGARDLSSLWWLLLAGPFMTLSLMCIYEIGYFENDFVAAPREASPTVSAEAPLFVGYPIEPSAWLWSLLFALCGLLIADRAGLLLADLSTALMLWLALLLLTRCVFFVYNRQAVALRVATYLPLQVLKTGSVFAVFEMTALGAVLAASQAVMMWLVYVGYRLGVGRGLYRKESIRFGVFLVGSALLVAFSPESVEGGFSVVVILVWLCTRLCKEALGRYFRGDRTRFA